MRRNQTLAIETWAGLVTDVTVVEAGETLKLDRDYMQPHALVIKRGAKVIMQGFRVFCIDTWIGTDVGCGP